MTTIQDLPDLAIIGILRYAMNKATQANDIVYNLSYLTVCHRWRRLGLPFIYDNILLKYGDTNEDNEVEEEEEEEEEEYKFSSNLSLITNNHCNSLVKRLNFIWLAESFTDDLHILMDAIGIDKMLWSKDVSGHLVGDTQNHSEDYNPQKLDNEMYEKMSDIIDNFSDTFPNVREIKFKILNSCGVASQFVSKFVEVYLDQLTKLKINDIPLNLPCFPPNLSYLSYICQPASFLPIPIINAFPLKMLKLENVPQNFSWKQCCNSLVFPNLDKLHMHCLDNDHQREREDLAHKLGIQLDIPDKKQEQLEFPIIQTLVLYLYDAQINRFRLKVVPEHLYELDLICTLASLYRIRKLPIYSIHFVYIMLYSEITDTDAFYSVTNRLLSDYIINNYWSMFHYYFEEPDIDFQDAIWDNVAEMNFKHLDSDSLVKGIHAIPRLREFGIVSWSYIDEDVDWSTLANSKIYGLVLGSCQYDGPLEKPANFVLQLLKSLKCLQKASVSETLRNVLVPQLKEAEKEHQHLKELEIKWI